MIYLASASLTVLAFLVIWQSYATAAERRELLASFAAEREIWVRERRDLLNRIQVPEAAPFMTEEPEDGDNDLPTLPGFTMDAETLEQAKRELASVGYESGPAT